MNTIRQYIGNMDADISYGGVNLIDLLSAENSQTIHTIIRNRLETLIGELQNNNLLDEQTLQQISKVEFTTNPSHNINASAQSQTGQYKITVNTGLVRFLVLMNMLNIPIINHNEPDEELRYQIKLNILNIFLYLIDDSRDVSGINCKIPSINSEGFVLEIMGLEMRHLEDAPFHMAFHHQLEFILLHEIGHIVFSAQPNNKQDAEFLADKFAVTTSRQLWKSSTSYHTVFCEFFQLVTFLYFDFYNFLERALDKYVHFATAPVKVPSQKSNYPENLQRFKNILTEVNFISETTKYFIILTEYIFDQLKTDMILSKVELTQFKRLGRIRAENILSRRMKNMAGVDGNEEFLENLEKKTIIHSKDTIDIHLPNDNKILNPNIWLNDADSENELGQQAALDQVFNQLETYRFTKAIAASYGELDMNKMVEDAKRGWRIYKPLLL